MVPIDRLVQLTQEPDRTEVLLAAGVDVNARTNPGVETGAFMRDTRTRGETALHRAAAYGTANVIRLLIDAGAVVSDAGDSL